MEEKAKCVCLRLGNVFFTNQKSNLCAGYENEEFLSTKENLRNHYKLRSKNASRNMQAHGVIKRGLQLLFNVFFKVTSIPLKGQEDELEEVSASSRSRIMRRKWSLTITSQ